MVVEDDALVAMAPRLTVEDLGHDMVGESDTVREALALARRTRPDVVLMDVRLRGPGDGSIEAAAVIRHETGARIVFPTGSSESEARRRLDARAGPEVRILVKPVRADDVVDALTAVLEAVQAS